MSRSPQARWPSMCVCMRSNTAVSILHLRSSHGSPSARRRPQIACSRRSSLRKFPSSTNFLSKIGLGGTLGGTLDSKQGRFSLIGMQRGVDRPQFDDDDIAALERLMPHLSRALQLRRAFFRMEGKINSLEATADRLPVGLVLLASDGGALFVNLAMCLIAQRNDGFALDRAGHPLPMNLPARRRFEVLLHDVNNGGAGGILTVPRASDAPDYVVLIAPSPSEQTDLPWRRRQFGAIVLVHDPAARQKTLPKFSNKGCICRKGRRGCWRRWPPTMILKVSRSAKALPSTPCASICIPR